MTIGFLSIVGVMTTGILGIIGGDFHESRINSNH
jgi:hypothetical protein